MNADRTAPANATVRDSECPPATPYACDPSIEGIDEELEMRFFETQLATIKQWIDATNKELGSSVGIGGILLDSERFLINTGNATQVAALARKDELVCKRAQIFPPVFRLVTPLFPADNVSRQFCEPPLCTIEQYNRGTIVREATLAKPSEGSSPLSCQPERLWR